MSDLDVITEGMQSNSADIRAREFLNVLGIPENEYEKVLEDAVSHALGPRLEPPDHQRWVLVGPRNVGGRILAIAQDPTDPLVLYAGSGHGGLWRTADRGDTWEHLGEPEHNFPVAAIAIPEQDPNTIFIGTGFIAPSFVGGRGMYRVDVAGPWAPATFTRLAPAPPPGITPRAMQLIPSLAGASLRYTRIRMDPFRKDRFWAASQTGLWRWEPRATAGQGDFILDFPPPDLPDADPRNLPGPPGPGWKTYYPYATDVLVASDPDNRETIDGSLIPRYLVLYVAVYNRGVFRGRFDRSTRKPVFESDPLPVPPAGVAFGRIQLAMCEREPQRMYALMESDQNLTTPVYRSDDGGSRWEKTTAKPFDPAQKRGNYNLVLEVHPADPDVVYAGVVDAFLTRDGGKKWTRVLTWENFDTRGDYAQHADQHAALFDRFERRRLWIGNDGGLAIARDLQARPGRGYWRVRGHGIAAGQFQDVAVNHEPGLSHFTGGGLQDNGTWISYGGPTWIHIGGGDGGNLAFDPFSPGRRFVASHQHEHRVRSVTSSAGVSEILNLNAADLPESLASGHATAYHSSTLGTLEGDKDIAPFIPIIAQNPAAPQQMIIGWQASPGVGSAGVPPVPISAAYLYISPGNPTALAGPGVAVADKVMVTAACFGPTIAGVPTVEGWIGFDNGALAHTTDVLAAPWTAPPTALPLGASPPAVSRIVVHPKDPRNVVVCTSGIAGRVFITYDSGKTWTDITVRIPDALAVAGAASIPANQRRQLTATATYPGGETLDVTGVVTWSTDTPAVATVGDSPMEKGQLVTVAQGDVVVTATLAIAGGPPPATLNVKVTVGGGTAAGPFRPAERKFDLRGLPPAPLTSLAFNPDDPSQLFAGTLAGVYVLEGIPAPVPAAPPPAVPPAVNVDWRPFGIDLPLTLVNDLAFIPGTQMLRAATFGRGIWDCDVDEKQRPRAKLLIRQSIVENGFTDRFPRPMTHDPRIKANFAAALLDFEHAFDIRVDSSPFQFFDDRVDGVELDERIGVDALKTGVLNAVYVQVHNVGREAVDVMLHLYFRAGLKPVDLGDLSELYLPPDFEPPGAGSPLAGSVWTRVGPAQKVRGVGPGAPVVTRFDWTPPAMLLGQEVALLALCSGPDEARGALPEAPADGPGVSSWIRKEQRAAVRVVTVADPPLGEIYVSGGIDDDGRKGSVASTLRSPHIIVVPSVPDVAPEVKFRDLLDLRPQDRLVLGSPNHIYVRVRNRSDVTLLTEVELWAVKIKDDLTPDFDPDHWTRITPEAPDLLGVEVPAGAWALGHVEWQPDDPAEGEALKYYILVALVTTLIGIDPLPDKSVITSEETFWQFLARQDGSDNIVARAVRVVSP